jgi:hypothetical protein
MEFVGLCLQTVGLLAATKTRFSVFCVALEL